MIQVYTGNGKGKTTAALGLAIRALGRGHKVCLIQFMKKNVEYGEIKFLTGIDNLDVFQFGTEFLVDPENPAPLDYQEAEKAMNHAREIFRADNYDLIILDEINVAVAWGLVKLEEQLALMKLPTRAEVVMTGRYVKPEVAEKADLVTEMHEIKHYFKKGVDARLGIEY